MVSEDPWLGTLAWWLTTVPGVAAEVEKANAETRAWLAEWDSAERFVKFVPTELIKSRAHVEMAISRASLHPAIIPLRKVVHVQDWCLVLILAKVFETNGDER